MGEFNVVQMTYITNVLDSHTGLKCLVFPRNKVNMMGDIFKSRSAVKDKGVLLPLQQNTIEWAVRISDCLYDFVILVSTVSFA